MGGACASIKKKLCCCSSCRYSNSSTPSNSRFGQSRRNKGRIQDEYVRERFAVPEGTYNVKLPGEKNVTINSSAFLPTGDIVLADSVNKKLKLFNCNFQFVSFLEFPAPVQQVCASPNLPLLYASFPDRVRQIHVDGVQLKRSGFIKTPNICRGVFVNRYEGKAISLSLDEDIGQVNLLTPGGNLQIEMLEDDEGRNLFVRPEQVVVTRDLNVLVADRGQRCVVAVSPEGRMLFQYKGIRIPMAIVCDEQNHIYVAGPHSIHQLNEWGELVKLFLTRAEIGLSPLSLSYNPNKRLMLATGKGAKVKLFKLIDS